MKEQNIITGSLRQSSLSAYTLLALLPPVAALPAAAHGHKLGTRAAQKASANSNKLPTPPRAALLGSCGKASGRRRSTEGSATAPCLHRKVRGVRPPICRQQSTCTALQISREKQHGRVRAHIRRTMQGYGLWTRGIFLNPLSHLSLIRYGADNLLIINVLNIIGSSKFIL